MTGTTDDKVTMIIADGSYAERLVCDPRLPLVAGLDSARPAVRVWEFGSGGLREVDIVGREAEEYPTEPWKRHRLVPSIAWHPYESELLVTDKAGLRQWTADGTTLLAGAPARAAYRHVAFSPDGSRTLSALTANEPGTATPLTRSQPPTKPIRPGCACALSSTPTMRDASNGE